MLLIHPMRLSVFLFFVLLHLTIFAQISPSYSFLNLPNNASDASINGIPRSIQDSNFMQVSNNPVFLSSLHNGILEIDYMSYVADIHAGRFSYAYTTKNGRVFLPSLKYIYYGNFIETNEYGEEIRDFSASDISLNLAYSSAFLQHFKYSIQGKVIYSQYLFNSSVAIGGDFYIIYSKKPEKYGVTLSVLNLGAPVTNYVPGTYQFLPLNIQLSSSFKLSHSPLRLHFHYHHLNKWDLTYLDEFKSTDPFTGEIKENTFTFHNFIKHIAFGADFVPSSKFRISASYYPKRRAEMSYNIYNKLTGLAFGIGVQAKKWNIDYALQGQGVGLNTHFVSLSTNIHRFLKK